MAAAIGESVVPMVLEEMFIFARDIQPKAENVLLLIATVDYGHDGKEYLFPIAAKCQDMTGSIQTQLLRWAELSSSKYVSTLTTDDNK